MRRKLIAFDEGTRRALDLLARDSMRTWQELADEAFRDLLKKHGRPTDLRTALKESVKQRNTRDAEGTREKQLPPSPTSAVGVKTHLRPSQTECGPPSLWSGPASGTRTNHAGRRSDSSK